jgi:hypothetical protein
MVVKEEGPRVPTYLESYEAYLCRKMDEGGPDELMEECVREYNAVAQSDYRPKQLYDAWFCETLHRCTSCGVDFRSTAVEQRAAPVAEISCQSCASCSIRMEKGPESDEQQDAGSAR